MDQLTAARASARRGGRGRLLGIDAARALALIGMMAVHILPAGTSDGRPAWHYATAGGRSAALFAVLAGVGLALASGGATPPAGTSLRAARRATLARAGVLGAIGLFLGTFDSGVAVILVHYGFLFVVASALLGLRSKTLLGLAAFWVVSAPLVSHVLRSGGQEGPKVPGFDDLMNPPGFLTDVVVSGYYPVLTWTTYLLVGLAVGRSVLTSSRQALRLLLAGLGVAGAAPLASVLLLEVGGRELAPLPVQYFGTTPTDSWWYLAVMTPHSGSPLDLLHTTGSAIALIGMCLLVAAASRPAVVWLAGAGGMTLSLYSAHVLALASRVGLENRPRFLAINVVVSLLVGGVWRRTVGRGPLETLAASVAATAAATVPVTTKRE